MRHNNKPAFRKASPPLTRIAKVSLWLENSPTKKIVVAVAAILGASLSIWGEYKDYHQSQLRLEISIEQRNSFAESVAISMAQYLHFQDIAPVSPRILMPYFPVTVSVRNPTGKRHSIANCRLAVRFYQREGEFESDSYMTPSSVADGKIEPSPSMSIDGGYPPKAVQWYFFFLPEPHVEKVFSDKTTQVTRMQVRCKDEEGNQVASVW